MSQTSFTFADLQGEPSINIGLELGIFIYITQDGRWHVRWNGNEKGQWPITFFYIWGGDITASQITNIVTYRFDSGQPDSYSQQRGDNVDILNFNGVVFSDVDGLDFDLVGDQATFNLSGHTQPNMQAPQPSNQTGQTDSTTPFLNPSLIFIGPNKLNPTANSFVVNQSAPPQQQMTSTMYWSNTGPANIQSAALTNPPAAPGILVSMTYTAYGMALDLAGQKMYWSDAAKTISTANLNGSDVTQLVNGLSFIPYGLELDLTNNLAYTAAASTAASPLSTAPTGQICRVNLSTGQTIVLVSDLAFPVDVALDLTAGKIYWVEYNGGSLGCANLDGSNITHPLTGLTLPQGVALDLTHGKLYWADKTSIGCANLDGSNPVVVAALPDALGNSLSRRVIVDALANRVYWSDRQKQFVQWANLGSVNATPQTILSDLPSPALLATFTLMTIAPVMQSVIMQ